MALDINWSNDYRPVKITADGSRTDFTPTWRCLAVSDVKVFSTTGDTTTDITSNATITLTSRGSIPDVSITPAPPSGTVIYVTGQGAQFNNSDIDLTAVEYNSSSFNKLFDRTNFAAAVVAFHAPHEDADANVQPDWAETDETAHDYIRNKPTTFSPNVTNYTVENSDRAVANSAYSYRQRIKPNQAQTLPAKTTRAGVQIYEFPIYTRTNNASTITLDDPFWIFGSGDIRLTAPLSAANLYFQAEVRVRHYDGNGNVYRDTDAVTIPGQPTENQNILIGGDRLGNVISFHLDRIQSAVPVPDNAANRAINATVGATDMYVRIYAFNANNSGVDVPTMSAFRPDGNPFTRSAAINYFQFAPSLLDTWRGDFSKTAEYEKGDDVFATDGNFYKAKTALDGTTGKSGVWGVGTSTAQAYYVTAAQQLYVSATTQSGDRISNDSTGTYTLTIAGNNTKNGTLTGAITITTPEIGGIIGVRIGSASEMQTFFNNSSLNSGGGTITLETGTLLALPQNDSTNWANISASASGGEENVQSDFNQTDNTADDFIKNKPEDKRYVPTTGAGEGRVLVDHNVGGEVTPTWHTPEIVVHAENTPFPMPVFKGNVIEIQTGTSAGLYISRANAAQGSNFTQLSSNQTKKIPDSLVDLQSPTGQGNKFLGVNAAGTAYEFKDAPSGGTNLSIRAGEPLEINQNQLQLNEDDTTVESFTNPQNRVVLRVKPGGIDTTQLANDAVDNDKLANDSVGANEIADNVIASNHFARGAVDTDAIEDDNVTEAKLANSINDKISANTAKHGLYGGHTSAVGVWRGVSGNPGPATVLSGGTAQFDGNDVYLAKTDATGKTITLAMIPNTGQPINFAGESGTVTSKSENSNRIIVVINYSDGSAPIAAQGVKYSLFNVANPSIEMHGVYADDETIDGTIVGDPADPIKVKDSGISTAKLKTTGTLATGKYLRVDTDTTRLEYVDAPTGGGGAANEVEISTGTNTNNAYGSTNGITFYNVGTGTLSTGVTGGHLKATRSGNGITQELTATLPTTLTGATYIRTSSNSGTTWTNWQDEIPAWVIGFPTPPTT